MLLRQKEKNYLENEIRFRERKNKNRGIINLLREKYPIFNSFSKEQLIDFILDFTTCDRHWRKILFEEPNLRGTDYDEKKKLSQEMQLGLGYEPGYYQNIKRLQKIK